MMVDGKRMRGHPGRQLEDSEMLDMEDIFSFREHDLRQEGVEVRHGGHFVYDLNSCCQLPALMCVSRSNSIFVLQHTLTYSPLILSYLHVLISICFFYDLLIFMSYCSLGLTPPCLCHLRVPLLDLTEVIYVTQSHNP